ncbi:DoxX family protein [Luteococcus sp. Sow4_B9]|uniref:DoxX family protein n=1 Tax=Luteococcus sp. Sow4_B9 TaxID=3438792 RepID=UPI003F98A3C4
MRHLTTPPAAFRDTALLIARIALGAILMAHGWQKFSEWGIAGTAANFDQMGVPAPTLSAGFAAVVELLGGLALLLGAFTPVAGLLVALNMFGAYLFAHAGKGLFVGDGGWELVGAIGAAGLALAATGAGRFSIDQLLTRPSATRTEHHGATRSEELVNA